MGSQERKKTAQEEIESRTGKRQLWPYALQKRRGFNARYPLPDLDCFKRNIGHQMVKEEEGVPGFTTITLSAPSHFYGARIGLQIGKMSRPMSTEKGRVGVRRFQETH